MMMTIGTHHVTVTQCYLLDPATMCHWVYRISGMVSQRFPAAYRERGKEPGLHRTYRGAIDMDVDCELSHL